MQITIDGKVCKCEKGEFLLEIARRNGIEIPTLCHHPALSEQGCCRVCIVEVMEHGRGRIVVSCVYPVEKDVEVNTHSERVRRERGVILSLLQKRAPESGEIVRLAEKYGAPRLHALRIIPQEKCVLCGLCVRACEALGTGAIATVNRGINKKVSTPFDEPSKDCVGCGSCARVCPTGCIALLEEDDARFIWGQKFPLIHCAKCGDVMGTEAELRLAAEKSGQAPEALCETCRKKRMAQELAHTYGLE